MENKPLEMLNQLIRICGDAKVKDVQSDLQKHGINKEILIERKVINGS